VVLESSMDNIMASLLLLHFCFTRVRGNAFWLTVGGQMTCTLNQNHKKKKKLRAGQAACNAGGGGQGGGDTDLHKQQGTFLRAQVG
jgi:hypothetical protein